MSINVEYSAPASVIADAAYAGGLGEFMARRNQQILQQQQLAQNDQHFQQDLAARLYQQQQTQLANQASQVFNADRQAMLFGLNRGADLQDMQTRRGWQEADVGQQHRWHVADTDKQYAHSDALQQAQQQFQQDQYDRSQQSLWQRQSVEQSENSIDATMKHIADNLDLLPQQAQQDFQKLYGPWNAIKSDRALKTSPTAYGEALSQFGQDLQKSGVMERMKPRLNTAQQFQEETTPIPGIGIVGRDRSGAWRKIADQPDPVGDFVTKNLRYYKDEQTGDIDFDKAMQDAEKYVSARQRMQSGQVQPANDREKHQQAWDNLQKDFPEAAHHYEQLAGGPPVPPKQTEVDNAISGRARELGFDPQRLTPSAKAELGRQVQRQQTQMDKLLLPSQPQAAPQQPPPPPPGIEPQAMGTEKVRAVSGPNVMEEAARAYLGGRKASRGSASPEASTATPAKLSDLPAAARKSGEANYPRPKTSAQRDMLPPGTQYVAPDGTLRIVPQRATSIPAGD